jgi:hypothetical protein
VAGKNKRNPLQCKGLTRPATYGEKNIIPARGPLPQTCRGRRERTQPRPGAGKRGNPAQRTGLNITTGENNSQRVKCGYGKDGGIYADVDDVRHVAAGR